MLFLNSLFIFLLGVVSPMTKTNILAVWSIKTDTQCFRAFLCVFLVVRLLASDQRVFSSGPNETCQQAVKSFHKLIFGLCSYIGQSFQFIRLSVEKQQSYVLIRQSVWNTNLTDSSFPFDVTDDSSLSYKSLLIL